ncbi:Dynamin-1 [Halotydeus destructor]|nr:Dynamin-1 [Halotydeus destructor]
MVESKPVSGHRNDGMNSLVELVNQLQDIFGRLDNKDLALSLPQIAVVGGQSSGKSSVLESIVGEDFLPRGSGIVTRCPLVLQMKNRDCQGNQLVHYAYSRSDDLLSEYWQFDHLDDKIFTTAESVRDEIAKRTDEIAGSDKRVTNIAITLKFFSPSGTDLDNERLLLPANVFPLVLDLTLVDLPGLTRIAIEGQPADIAEQIRALVFEYVGNPNVLILSITQANQDLATSDAIKVASEADPEFERTIGVLTKLDLVEPENEKTVRDVLDNKVFRLKYGFTGVINRSQKDIDDGQSMKFANEKESEILRRMKWFKPIQSRLGTKYLQEILNKQLLQHISRNMPNITLEIKQHLEEAKKKLLQYGDLSDDEASLMKTLAQLVECLKLALSKSLKGAGDVGEGDKLSKGFELRERLIKYRDTLYLIQFDEAIVKKAMFNSLRSMQGLEPGIFPSDKAMVGVIEYYTNKFVGPVNEILNGIENSMMALINELVKTFDGYPKLKESSLRILKKNLRECVERTLQRVDLFALEDKAYIDLESENLKAAYKKLDAGSSSLLASSDGLYQELCSGILKGSDWKLYNCKLTPAKLIFQQVSGGSSELPAEYDVLVTEYWVDYNDDETFELDFVKCIGGIDQLLCDKHGETVAAENATSWIRNLKELSDSNERKKITSQSDEVEVLNEPPEHSRAQIDAMFEIFLSLMEVSKKKYSEHVRKIICYNTIFCFQNFVDTQEFFGELVKASEIKTMMGRSAAAKAEIENLQDEVEACREALDVIEIMDAA